MTRVRLSINQGRKGAFATVAVVAALLLAVGVAYADTNRVTEGDVQSVLHAFTTGGRVVLLQASETAGFHAGPAHLFNGSIRPFPSSPWDGSRHCVDDWHVILIGIFEGGDKSFKKKDAVEVLSPFSLTFQLGDDPPLSTERTSIKRFTEADFSGFEKAYGFQEGRIMSPDELGVGEYELTLLVQHPDLADLELSIKFFIDGSGSATCTG